MNAKLIKRGQDDSANLGSANQITCQGFAKKNFGCSSPEESADCKTDEQAPFCKAV